MAEGVVFGALCKVGSVLASSASITMFARLDAKLTIISEIESRIKQIEVELKLMQAFLRQAQNQEGYDEPTEIYLEEVRKLAFEIEDIMDEFLYLTVQHNSKFFTGEFLSYFRKLRKTPWHKIARELKDLQSHLQNLRNLRVQYEIQLPGGDRVSTSTEDSRIPLYLSYPANETVGIEEERRKLMQWLTARVSSTSVISVWGMGGSGKTTLVNIMYEDEMIKNQFDCHIWITVSQKFNPYGIIRKVIRHILKGACPSDIDTINGRDLIQILQRTLQQRKFMLVLDDVWSVDVWMDLANLIGNNNVSGNKVVITTRIKEVASLASEDQVIELQKLNEADSWSLFCRWAFKSCRDRCCPQEMEPLVREIIEKCDGLPLAIVTVGNTLSFKRPVTEEWSKYNDQLSWELRDRLHGQELNSVMKILNLSYKYLPSHLKNAFVFCSIFPEDYMMTKKRLVRLWVAEGLVKPEKRRTIEEVAEEYLNELIDRCLLKVVERKHFRKVREFQMHDIVRELAISISEKETFCKTYSKSQPSESEYKCRRLSIHEHSDRFQPVSDSSRLRSLYQFDASCSSFPSVSTQRTARYLNVLELQGAAITVLPEEVSAASINREAVQPPNYRCLPHQCGEDASWDHQTEEAQTPTCREVDASAIWSHR
jgi:disease resistance protein RPM1